MDTSTADSPDPHLDAVVPEPQGDGATSTAERLRAAREALAIAMHEGPVQNLTMLGIRLEQARARLARGEVAETERALNHLQAALANEISALRRMLNAATCEPL